MRIYFYSILLVSFSSFGQGTVIFNEDFQQGIPANFTMLNLDLNAPNTQVSEFNAPWITALDPENPLDNVAAATSFFENPDTANRWLITPSISLGAFGNYLTWNAKSQDASYPDNYLVLLSTTDNQTSSFTDTIAFITGENFEWISREVNLTGQGFDNAVIHIAFVLRTYDGFKLYIDDIEVRTMDNTSIEEPSLPFLSFYPNPASNVLHMNQSGFIQIYSTTGSLMYSGNDSEISIESLTSGMYLIKAAGYSPARFIKL
ncbi:MAG: hypothetical protein RL365_1641 [Bacteroidota bacterium]|jgi:hypothetical protein